MAGILNSLINTKLSLDSGFKIAEDHWLLYGLLYGHDTATIIGIINVTMPGRCFSSWRSLWMPVRKTGFLLVILIHSINRAVDDLTLKPWPSNHHWWGLMLLEPPSTLKTYEIYSVINGRNTVKHLFTYLPCRRLPCPEFFVNTTDPPEGATFRQKRPIFNDQSESPVTPKIIDQR